MPQNTKSKIIRTNKRYIRLFEVLTTYIVRCTEELWVSKSDLQTKYVIENIDDLIKATDIFSFELVNEYISHVTDKKLEPIQYKMVCMVLPMAKQHLKLLTKSPDKVLLYTHSENPVIQVISNYCIHRPKILKPRKSLK